MCEQLAQGCYLTVMANSPTDNLSVASVANCYTLPLGVLEHSSSCCCSNPNEGTLLLCISVYAVSVDVLTHAVDLHKTASR